MTYKAYTRNIVKKPETKTEKKIIVLCMACGRPVQEGKLCNRCKFYK